MPKIAPEARSTRNAFCFHHIEGNAMSLITNIDHLHVCSGIEAVAVVAPNQPRAFRGDEAWCPVLDTAIRLFSMTSEQSIRMVVGNYTLLIQSEGPETVSVVLPTGHAIAKSLRRMIRRMSRKNRAPITNAQIAAKQAEQMAHRQVPRPVPTGMGNMVMAQAPMPNGPMPNGPMPNGLIPNGSPVMIPQSPPMQHPGQAGMGMRGAPNMPPMQGRPGAMPSPRMDPRMRNPGMPPNPNPGGPNPMPPPGQEFRPGAPMQGSPSPGPGLRQPAPFMPNPQNGAPPHHPGAPGPMRPMPPLNQGGGGMRVSGGPPPPMTGMSGRGEANAHRGGENNDRGEHGRHKENNAPHY